MLKQNIKLLWIISLILLLFSSLMASSGCQNRKNMMDATTEDATSEDETSEGLLIAVGRLALNNNEVTLYVDSTPIEYNLIKDESGGYWAHIPFNKLTADSKVRLNIVKTNPDNLLYEEEIDTALWTKPTYFFDSDNITIKDKAEELTADCTTNNEKVEKFHEFILNDIPWKLSPGMHNVQASEVLQQKHGICVGKSRLLIALCRAEGIPARSIQGTVYDLNNNAFWHHEWVEFYNDNKEWRQIEPNLDLSEDFYIRDLKYFDLVYNFEGNSFHEFTMAWGEDGYKLENGSVSVFMSDIKLQFDEGKMNFTLVNSNLPESIEIETVYDMSKYTKYTNLFE
jgi:hypothetical protein